MSCGNSNCGCGSSCSCGSGCSCGKRNFELGLSDEINTSASVIISGFAPMNAVYESSEQSYGAENGGCGTGCKCGSSCGCGSGCKCGK